MNDKRWEAFRKQMENADVSDLSEKANLWAECEAELMCLPGLVVDWKESMALAFEAGRRWAAHEAAAHEEVA